MPRPVRTRTSAPSLVAALCCAALGPATLHAALAAAAGTLFEAAPFVLVAEALPKRRGLRVLAAFAGCGCGALIPGALSFAAIGLCWLTFGPAVAIARSAAGAALLFRRRSRGLDRRWEPADAFAELLSLVPSAAAAAVFSNSVAEHAAALSATPAGSFAALAIGLVLGVLAPCGTAAVAIAAAFAAHLPFAAAGVLSTGGLFPRSVLFGGRRSPYGAPQAKHDGDDLGDDGHDLEREHGNDNGRLTITRLAIRPPINFARLALGVALGTLALGGPRGFINPRLVPFEAVAAAISFAGMRRTRVPGRALTVPAILLVALASGSPEPAYLASETRLDDAFAGERVSFTGVAHRDATRTIVQRFAITCCRVDASAIAIRTTTPLPVPDGSWIEATGVLLDSPGGLLLRPSFWHRIARPADPFVYR